ncbi:glycosyltransferase [Leifsonia xyli]|uniref:glycosyltransferase n=1 Tax=Leifsonia xyli TaxID=1575 RepID=UPI001F17AED7|nr:glycosyltransferase [Leifsonia xyli]
MSVVIPTMNTRGALDDAVASALAQRDVDVEVIVAMNGQGPDPVLGSNGRCNTWTFWEL